MDQRVLDGKGKILKKLQDTKEENWQFSSIAKMSGVIRRAEAPREIILLLHGLGERGKRIFRKLSSYLPEDATVLAPNAPFPIERNRENKLDFGHSWYFYDKFEKTYFINQDLAKFWLRDLVRQENPNNLPVTIIGFSQGGYLSPLVGYVIPETKLIIGISCEFRTVLFHEKVPYKMVAIHGEDDEIVPMQMALTEIEKLRPMGIEVDFYGFQKAAHTITSDMGKKIQSIMEEHGTRSL